MAGKRRRRERIDAKGDARGRGRGGRVVMVADRGAREERRARDGKKMYRGEGEGEGEIERKAERIHACHGTEQTRASRAYDGADAHLRLEDKHRHLYKLADTLGLRGIRGV